MTSLTGSTQATLEGTRTFPPPATIFGGCAFQLVTIGAVWCLYSPFSTCLADRTACWSDPWSKILLIHVGVMTLVYLYSLRTIPSTGTSDPSIVDRLWSMLPWIYTWVFVYWSPSPRLCTMAACSTAWGVRLTTNFIVKGGFSGGEDYRWVELRKHFQESAPLVPCLSWGFHFELFNLFFIVLAQLLIVLGFTSPAVLDFYDARPWNLLDTAATALFAAFFATETIADSQMMAFQTEKYRRIQAKEPLGEYANGFIESGLWACSRHPNYFGELGMWWAYYLFGVAASGDWLNWTLVGPVFLNILFLPPQASLDVTETLSSKKYKGYADYQNRVSRIIPWFPTDRASQIPSQL